LNGVTVPDGIVYLSISDKLTLELLADYLNIALFAVTSGITI